MKNLSLHWLILSCFAKPTFRSVTSPESDIEKHKTVALLPVLSSNAFFKIEK